MSSASGEQKCQEWMGPGPRVRVQKGGVTGDAVRRQ